ncbi:MAG: hypothetical protein AABY50_00085 [Nitrospirota bacterium]
MEERKGLKDILEKISTEIGILESEKKELTDKMSIIVENIQALLSKQEIVKRALEMLEEGDAVIKASVPRIRMAPIRSLPHEEKTEQTSSTGRGMTGATYEILSPAGKYLSVPEIHAELKSKGYEKDKINVYVMLSKLKANRKLVSKKEGGQKKYALPH